MTDDIDLIKTLEERLPDIRRELGPQQWARFTELLAEAAPHFAHGKDDPDQWLEALYLLKRALIEFPATRRVLPLPGGALAPRAQGPTPDTLPPLAHRQQDAAVLAQRLCAEPDRVADEQEARRKK
ncbi:MAG: hypothetical protein QHJ34_08725 [bacterium]|jgi:hypothetical protein|nr:hypothetical protein [candidate division KSB1 bacterium]MDH7560297.1 hypothetical protein [bacterium]